MASTTLAYLKLVVEPVPKVWGWVTVGVPYAVALVLWAFEYGLWSAGIGLVSTIIFLAIAGYRLQRRVAGMEATRALRAGLARFLDESKEVQSTILVAAALSMAREVSNEWPQPDSDAAKFAERAKNDTEQWEQAVDAFLSTNLGPEYVSLFHNRAGLPPIKPPAEWFSQYWRDYWDRVQQGCMRVEEFIKEVPR